MNKKITTIGVITILLIISTMAMTATSTKNPVSKANKTFLPENLDSKFTLTIESFWIPMFDNIYLTIDHRGDSTIHNVKVDVTFNGKLVLDNTKPGLLFADNMSMHNQISKNVDVDILGFGRFTATVHVYCDEGLEATDTADGIMIGRFIFWLDK